MRIKEYENKLDNHLQVAQQEFLYLFNQINPKGISVNSKNVLDLGCRDTHNRDFFKSLNLQWTGSDINGGESVYKCSMEETPFPDNTFAYIFCSHALEHSLNPVKALQECKRIMQGGAIAFFVTPYPTENQLFSMDKQHLFVLNDLQLMRLFTFCGFYIYNCYIAKQKGESNEDNWNIITIAKVI